MAKKEGGGAARLSKAQKMKTGKPCPVCGEIYDQLLVVDPRASENGYRFSRNFVKVCKCNKSQYGL